MEDRNKIEDFCKMMIKHSPCNVTHPLPLIKEKAEKKLSVDGLISFNIMLKEWDRISPEDKKEIAKLLLLSSHKVADVMDATHELLDETKDVFDYVNEHPEYANKNELDQDDMLRDIEKLFGL